MFFIFNKLIAASACFVFNLGAARLYLGDAHLT